MANEEDRTESRPTPISDDQAEAVVGGSNQPADDYSPCQQQGCNCEHDNQPDCTCVGHPHLM